jgi:hypothetical protein
MTPFTFGRNILSAEKHENIIKGIHHMVLGMLFHNQKHPTQSKASSQMRQTVTKPLSHILDNFKWHLARPCGYI